MIQLTGTYAMYRDKYQWCLEQKLPKGKHPITGEMSKTDKVLTTYHSNPEQILNTVINRSLGKCESLEEMRDMLLASKELVSHACSEINKANV